MYILHTDSGHGWLSVKRAELKELGILDKISSYSYQKGDTVYLEEDEDATIFIETKYPDSDSIESFNNNLKESYKDSSPIRKYKHFKL